MRSWARISRKSQVFFFAVLFAVICAVPAQAGEVVFSPQNDPPKDEDGWQAGTCNTSTCAPESPPVEFFETAAGHPPFGMTGRFPDLSPSVLRFETASAPARDPNGRGAP